jgi:hypothetical protein
MSHPGISSGPPLMPPAAALKQGRDVRGPLALRQEDGCPPAEEIPG